MTALAILPSKRSDAIVPFTFNFGDQLQFGETITGTNVQVAVFSGVDPNPNDILSGTASVSGMNVTQVFTGGVPGVIYQITVLVTGSGTHIYTKNGTLAIVDSPNSYTG